MCTSNIGWGDRILISHPKCVEPSAVHFSLHMYLYFWCCVCVVCQQIGWGGTILISHTHKNHEHTRMTLHTLYIYNTIVVQKDGRVLTVATTDSAVMAMMPGSPKTTGCGAASGVVCEAYRNPQPPRRLYTVVPFRIILVASVQQSHIIAIHIATL